VCYPKTADLPNSWYPLALRLLRKLFVLLTLRSAQLYSKQNTVSETNRIDCKKMRCETLHVAGIHPQQRPADLSATQLLQLTGSCLQLARQSYETGGITNDMNRATTLRQQGASFEACRFHVYRRGGMPCYRCDTGIIKGKFCGRTGYLCPTRQR
jgi:hypothetical protein